MEIKVRLFALALCLALGTGSVFAQKMSVKVINRQDHETGYSYQVPAHWTSSSNSSVNCYAGSSNVDCTGSSRSYGYGTASHVNSYSVTGATFSLLLPDGRLTVVNCVSKYRPRGDYINRRSCRTPLVDDIQVEFKGKKAKLEWPVSLDGKKFESETYSILAVYPKQAEPDHPTP